MNNLNSWIFISVFPNLLLNVKFETSHSIIGPYDDERVKASREKFKPIDQLLDSFIDTHLNKYKPAVLLIDKKIYSNKKDRHEAIVAFRNIIALNVILQGWVPLVHDKQFGANAMVYSDYYDLFPLDGYGEKLYSVKSPALNSIVSNAKIKYQSNYLLPDSDSFYPFINNYLFDPLITLWENYYINKNREHPFSNIFRSLQLAFSASKMPTDNFS